MSSKFLEGKITKVDLGPIFFPRSTHGGDVRIEGSWLTIFSKREVIETYPGGAIRITINSQKI